MKNSNIEFTGTKIIVTYDLNNNDISAQAIANASNGIFSTNISIQNGVSFALPNTTLASSELLSIDDAVNKFKQAFNAAKSLKLYSSCSISRILVCEVANKSGYIENN